MLNGINVYSLNLDDAQAPSWAAIRRADFVFVFLKTYEYREDDGTILLPNGAIDQVRTPAHLVYGFANRWPALAKAGFIRGTFDLVHHNAGTATAQATQVARIIKRLVPGDLGPSLDMEDRDTKHNHANDPGYWVSFAHEYLDAIETALGRQPMIYTSRSYWSEFTNDSDEFIDYPLWVIRISTPPSADPPPAWPTWTFWQWHADESKTPKPSPFRNPRDKGVDLNYFNGTMYELRGLADIGRPGVALISGSTSIAHSELDEHLHLLMNDGSSWNDTDLGQGDLPGGGADPVLLESAGTLFLYFRSGDAVIEAISSGASSWETNDLTQISSARPIHDPRVVIDGDKRHVVYWAEDDDWYLLTRDSGWTSVGVLRDAQLGTSTGQPVVFVQDGLPHVAGRIDGDGHLWDVWPDLAGGWKAEDVTAAALANDPATPAATYSPCAYETSTGVSLAFRAVRGEMWVIDRTSNTPTNLTAATSGVPGMGHPTCFVLKDIPHVVYRGLDGIIHDLWLESGGWHVQPVCDDRMASDPVATADGSNAAVAVRAPDGIIHLAVFDGSGWKCDPTMMATPPATGTPAPDDGVDDKSVG